MVGIAGSGEYKSSGSFRKKQNVFKMFSKCFQNVFKMFSKCFQNVFKMFHFLLGISTLYL